MAATQFVEMPSYIIYRNTQPGQLVDLAAPLEFWPPMGSDELFDALRSKFPHLKTHSERVGQATVEFFLEEDMSQFSTPQTATSANVSPWEASLPSFCSEASTWSSPDGIGPATPSLTPQSSSLSRQESVSTSFCAQNGDIPPALEQMTSVFSLGDSAQPKQHVRRKMTESEKIEYRKRRVVKACDKCAKRKRKCIHNQEQMESGPIKTPKVIKPDTIPTTKRRAASQLPKIHESGQQQYADYPGVTSNTSFESMPSFDSFDVSLPDLDLDAILAEQPQWPWSDTQDWQLFDAPTDSNDLNRTTATQHTQPSYPFAPFDESGLRYRHSSNDSFQTDTEKGRFEHLRGPHDDSQLGELSSGQGRPQSRVMDSNERYVNPMSLFGRGMREDSSHSSIANEQTNVDDLLQDKPKRAMILSQRSPVISKRAETTTAADSRASQRSPSPVGHSLTFDGDDQYLETLNRHQHSSKRRRTRNPGLGMNHAPGSSKGMLQQESQQTLSFGGDGATSNVNPSTELFMLKRRLPSTIRNVNERSTSSSTSASMLRVQTADLWQLHLRHRGDGGELAAERTLSDTAGSTPSLEQPEESRRLSNLLELVAATGTRDASRHRRPRGPTVSGSDASTATAATHTLVYKVPTPTRSGAAENDSQRELVKFNASMPGEERLCDHVRRRDHFGRSSGFGLQALTMIIAGLACMLMLAALLPMDGLRVSMIILAIACPVSEGKGWPLMSRTPKQLKDKSSSWPTATGLRSIALGLC